MPSTRLGRSIRECEALILIALILLVSSCKQAEEPQVPVPSPTPVATPTPEPTPAPTPTPVPLPAPFETATGIRIEHLAAGTGPALMTGERVRVQYELRTRDGRVVDTSNAFEAIVGMGGFSGWDETLGELSVGDSVRATIPADHGGPKARRPEAIPAGEELILEIKVLEKLPPEAEPSSLEP